MKLNEHGAYYLFAVRMSPIFPFFVINAAFGLTKIKTLTFYLISQLGMLPGTIIIILIGSELNDFLIKGSPFSIDLVIYLTLLGLIPLYLKNMEILEYFNSVRIFCDQRIAVLLSN